MRIKTLSNQLQDYTYKVDRDYNKIQDRFLRNTLIALDYLVKTSALTITWQEDGKTNRVDVIDVLVEDVTNNITIIPATKNAYSPSRNTILFYDTHGVVFRKNHKRRWFRRNKGYNSPVSLLSHELIHCYNELYDTEDYLSRKQDHTSKGKKLMQMVMTCLSQMPKKFLL